AAHAVEHAAHERPLAERRVLGVVEREEEDPPDDAGGHRDEELGALEDVAVLAREGERVAADEIAVGEDLLLREVGARAALVEDGRAVDIHHAKPGGPRAIAPVDVPLSLRETLAEEPPRLERLAPPHAGVADHPVDVLRRIVALVVGLEATDGAD